MTDKTVIITGGGAGLGYECAKCLAASRQGWRVLIAGRNKQGVSEAATRLNNSIPGSQAGAFALDLASLDSVRGFVEDFRKLGWPPLRALICNAGIQIVTGTSRTRDGFEMTFGVNHLGHFLLVNLLMTSFVAPARIVVVSSDTHDPAQTTGMPEPHYESAVSLAYPPENDESDRSVDVGMMGRRRYTTSKLCNIYFTYELFRRLAEHGLSTIRYPITANAFNPGLMPGTGLARDYSPFMRFAWNYVLPLIRPVARLFVPMGSARRSGQALARLVLDPSLEGVSGKYYSVFDEQRSSDESYDLQRAHELWETSAKLVNLGRDETPL